MKKILLGWGADREERGGGRNTDGTREDVTCRSNDRIEYGLSLGCCLADAITGHDLLITLQQGVQFSDYSREISTHGNRLHAHGGLAVLAHWRLHRPQRASALQ